MNERMIFMYGVSKISSEQNIMLTTFPGAQYSAQSLAEHLDVFAKAGIVGRKATKYIVIISGMSLICPFWVSRVSFILECVNSSV